MFIKKDLRKIPRILADAAIVQEPPSVNSDDVIDPPPTKRSKTQEVLTELRLARRQAEFKGSVSILCQPKNVPSLRHLMSLSLYDCQIRSLEGIGLLGSPISDGSSHVSCPDLREINVGRNPITTLPDELALLSDSLKELWCDDCDITGPLPDCILQLNNLETLRLSNNSISSIPSEIGTLQELRTLCLDGNQIITLPTELSQLFKLKALLVRHNKLEELPEGVPGESMSSLELLHVSSNQLKALPSSLVYCTSLSSIYVNSNYVERLPVGLAIHLTNLKRLNISHNKMERLSTDFINRFGEPNLTDGTCNKDDECLILVCQNPVTDRMKKDAIQNDNGGMHESGAELISAA